MNREFWHVDEKKRPRLVARMKEVHDFMASKKRGPIAALIDWSSVGATLSEGTKTMLRERETTPLSSPNGRTHPLRFHKTIGVETVNGCPQPYRQFQKMTLELLDRLVVAGVVKRVLACPDFAVSFPTQPILASEWEGDAPPPSVIQSSREGMLGEVSFVVDPTDLWIQQNGEGERTDPDMLATKMCLLARNRCFMRPNESPNGDWSGLFV